jgi:N-acetylmuramoyl-L-alanine amidase
VRGRLAALDGVPKIKERYQRSVDPLAQFGLPTSQVVSRDDALVVRFQRAVIEEWKVDRPWAQAGEVTLASGGEIAKDAGLLPGPALTPQAWRPPATAPARPLAPFGPAAPAASQASALPASAPVVIAPRAAVLPPLRAAPTRADGRAWRVVLDPGHGGAESGSARPVGNGLVMVEKNVNLRIALSAAELLRGAGIEVALTRDNDRQVNWSAYDLNGDGQTTLADDLQARAEMANRFRADVFVSVHNNGHNNPAQYGTEVYFNASRSHSAHNWALAWYLNQRIVQLIRMTGYPTLDRGVKPDTTAGHGHFAVLGPESPSIPSPSRMAGALTESLFVSSYYDAPWLATTEVIDAIARGHAEGILDYLEWVQTRGS